VLAGSVLASSVLAGSVLASCFFLAAGLTAGLRSDSQQPAGRDAARS
jgi:hypothetical protein